MSHVGGCPEVCGQLRILGGLVWVSVWMNSEFGNILNVSEAWFCGGECQGCPKLEISQRLLWAEYVSLSYGDPNQMVNSSLGTHFVKIYSYFHLSKSAKFCVSPVWISWRMKRMAESWKKWENEGTHSIRQDSENDNEEYK